MPEEARNWVKAMIAGLQDGLDFDEVLAAHSEEFEAYDAWLTTLARIRTKAMMSDAPFA